MSWKSVEMQVALPRTQDAGKLQHQTNKQNELFQATLAQTRLSQEEEKRKKVQEYENIHLLKHSKQKSEAQQSNNNSNSDKWKQVIKHPYLGNNFDGRS